ncbi:MAG TPA: ribonuclease HII [Nitrososphaerales archaeon]|nr:ribonuclease HII [Nitrososphaerales archaeon]
MTEVVGGVDEAGRGCVLGPLVVAGVSLPADRVQELKDLGVKDSKKLSAKRREKMYPKILRVCTEVRSASIPPREIDEVVKAGVRLRSLNYLEALYFAKVIDALGADRVNVDASDTSPRRFGGYIVGAKKSATVVKAAHKADRDDPVVSAASIVAKVRRDRAVSKLRVAHGDFGSGYPSDPVTRAFFSDRLLHGEPLPPFVRTSWKTWENLWQTVLA